jgi:hypothetical protein
MLDQKHQLFLEISQTALLASEVLRSSACDPTFPTTNACILCNAKTFEACSKFQFLQ